MSTIAVILAGGLSSRMGLDKALMHMTNKGTKTSVLNYIFQQLSQTSVRKTIISRNDNNSEHLPDLIPNKGPLSGIHSAAMHYPTDNLLIVPVDLPLIDSLTLEKLVEYGNRHHNNSAKKDTDKAGSSTTDTAVKSNVRYGKQCLPLYLNNTDATRKVLDHTLRCTTRFSVNHFCTHFPLIELSIKNQLSLFNTNTPEQWQFAKHHFLINKPLTGLEDSYESFKQSI